MFRNKSKSFFNFRSISSAVTSSYLLTNFLAPISVSADFEETKNKILDCLKKCRACINKENYDRMAYNLRSDKAIAGYTLTSEGEKIVYKGGLTDEEIEKDFDTLFRNVGRVIENLEDLVFLLSKFSNIDAYKFGQELCDLLQKKATVRDAYKKEKEKMKSENKDCMIFGYKWDIAKDFVESFGSMCNRLDDIFNRIDKAKSTEDFLKNYVIKQEIVVKDASKFFKEIIAEYIDKSEQGQNRYIVERKEVREALGEIIHRIRVIDLYDFLKLRNRDVFFSRSDYNDLTKNRIKSMNIIKCEKNKDNKVVCKEITVDSQQLYKIIGDSCVCFNNGRGYTDAKHHGFRVILCSEKTNRAYAYCMSDPSAAWVLDSCKDKFLSLGRNILREIEEKKVSNNKCCTLNNAVVLNSLKGEKEEFLKLGKTVAEIVKEKETKNKENLDESKLSELGEAVSLAIENDQSGLLGLGLYLLILKKNDVVMLRDKKLRFRAFTKPSVLTNDNEKKIIKGIINRFNEAGEFPTRNNKSTGNNKDTLLIRYDGREELYSTGKESVFDENDKNEQIEKSIYGNFINAYPPKNNSEAGTMFSEKAWDDKEKLPNENVFMRYLSLPGMIIVSCALDKEFNTEADAVGVILEHKKKFIYENFAKHYLTNHQLFFTMRKKLLELSREYEESKNEESKKNIQDDIKKCVFLVMKDLAKKQKDKGKNFVVSNSSTDVQQSSING